MKTIKLFFSAAVMVLLAAACAEEIVPAQADDVCDVTFTANIGEPSTKTTIDYERKLSMWYGLEYISVLNGTENYGFIANVTEPSATATFSKVDDGRTYNASDVVAMYPARQDYTLDKESMTVHNVSVESTQQGIAGDFCATSAVMMACTAGNELYFKNATSLIRMRVMDPGIWSVVIKANGCENMAGVFNLKWNDGSPQFVPQENVVQYEHIYMYPSAAGFGVNADAFTEGEYYYVSVVPGTYSQGFTVTLNNIECKVTSKAITLERNTIYDLGELALPEVKSWGISGTMTGWGELREDYPLADEGDWMVYRGLPVSFNDRFQFRADNEWGRQVGYSGLVSSGVAYEVDPADRNDIYVYESGIYDVYLAKDLKSLKIEKVGDIEGKPEAGNWGIVGTMNGWGNSGEDIAMTLEGNVYVARNVTVYADDMFKFRVDNDWNKGDLGGETAEGAAVRPKIPYRAYAVGSNVVVEQSGVYDIYLSCYEDGFRVMKVGEAAEKPAPEPGSDVTVYFKPASNWNPADYTIAAWIWMTDANGTWWEMTDSDSDGIYEVTFPDTFDNIIFASLSGALDWNVMVKQTPNLRVPADDNNTYLAYTGTWMTLAAARDYEEEPEDGSMSTWYLTGDFNNWSTNDPLYRMSVIDGWHVFLGFDLQEASFVKFAEGGWSVNRGGDWVDNGAIAVTHDGANIAVPAGVYDVYLREDLETAYFLAPGVKP